MFRTFLPAFLAVFLGIAGAEPVTIRVTAANLTSGSGQSYSPDNGNHSNPEGAGARIIKGLKPDIVLIQEFNTTIPVRQWVNQTLGEEYVFVKEEGMQIPNGIISRFPIAASGSWDDPQLTNREFLWANIKLPGGKDLWAISVHLHSKNEPSRETEAEALLKYLRREKLPKDAMIVLGGDFNTRGTDEKCFKRFDSVFVIPKNPPADQLGDITTNSPRNKPYDWIIASEPLDKLATPVKLAGHEFPNGLVFDSRVFEPIDQVPPVQKEDSAAPAMQHMAVTREFTLP